RASHGSRAGAHSPARATEALADDLAREERVRAALLADGGGRAVSGVDDGLIRQREDLLADGLHEERVRALPQVRPPDGAGEEDVAADDEPVGLVDEDDVAGGVTGRVADGEGAAAEGDRLACFEEVRRRG